MKKIKIGFSNKGVILEDFDKAKAYNFCTQFHGYGLHAWVGHCDYLKEDINGFGYPDNYRKKAQGCGIFECLPDFSVEIEE